MLNLLDDAPHAFLEELSYELAHGVGKTLARQGIVQVKELAAIAAKMSSPQGVFADLATIAAPDDIEALWQCARALESPRARLACLGSLLGTAPERHAEVLEPLPTLKDSERIWVLADAFTHLSPSRQISALEDASKLPNFDVGATSLARRLRAQAALPAWELFLRCLPTRVGPRAWLVGKAPLEQRAPWLEELVPLVRTGGRLGHGSISLLLPHAEGASRRALIDQAFTYDDSYAAANIARALGEALRLPAVEERYVTMLDLGLHDYQWDRITAYADIARQHGPRERHCRQRATSLLDLILGLPSVTTEVLQYPVAVNHRLNALLAVTRALTGEERENRQGQTLALLKRIGRDLSDEDMVPIIWARAAQLSPDVDQHLLDLIGEIREDKAAFEAWATLANTEPRLAPGCFERLERRLKQRWERRHVPPDLD